MARVRIAGPEDVEALEELWVLESNARARRFYERAGFRETGRRRHELRGHPFDEARYELGL